MHKYPSAGSAADGTHGLAFGENRKREVRGGERGKIETAAKREIQWSVGIEMMGLPR